MYDILFKHTYSLQFFYLSSSSSLFDLADRQKVEMNRGSIILEGRLSNFLLSTEILKNINRMATYIKKMNEEKRKKCTPHDVHAWIPTHGMRPSSRLFIASKNPWTLHVRRKETTTKSVHCIHTHIEVERIGPVI
jgi:hypothetical protein